MKLEILLAAFIFTGTACAGRMHNVPLIDDVNDYNEGIRWNHYPKSAKHIHPKERDQFVEERAELEDDLRISDYEVIHIAWLDNKRTTASVHVRYTWYLDSEGVVHTTSTAQKWKRFGKRWLVLGETRERGDEMPGVAEREEEPKAEPDVVPGARKPRKGKQPVSTSSASASGDTTRHLPLTVVEARFELR